MVPLMIAVVFLQFESLVDGGSLAGSSIVINEFMALPLNSATEREGEWMELYNNTGEWINLSGCVIRNGMGQQATLSTYLLPPEGYYIMAACGDESRNGGIVPNHVYSNFEITQTGSLTLYSSSMAVIDRIEYDSTWPVTAGVSCERINPGWVSNSSSSWDYSAVAYGSGDLGTPGSQNSAYQNSFAQNSWAFIKAFVQ